jgi:hypothetical protein
MTAVSDSEVSPPFPQSAFEAGRPQKALLAGVSPTFTVPFKIGTAALEFRLR